MIFDSLAYVNQEILSIADLLDVIYPDPWKRSELHDFDHWERRTHRDLAEMDADELHRELRRVRLRLDLDPSPDAWFATREEAIRDELKIVAAEQRRSPALHPAIPATPPRPQPARLAIDGRVRLPARAAVRS